MYSKANPEFIQSISSFIQVGLSDIFSLQNQTLSWHIPFAPLPLQQLHHYYGMIRPLYTHRYYPSSWISLIRFLLALHIRFPRSIETPELNSCHLYAGCHPASKQVASGFILQCRKDRSFDIVSGLTTLTVVHLSFIFLIHTCHFY